VTYISPWAIPHGTVNKLPIHTPYARRVKLTEFPFETSPISISRYTGMTGDPTALSGRKSIEAITAAYLFNVELEGLPLIAGFKCKLQISGRRVNH